MSTQKLPPGTDTYVMNTLFGVDENPYAQNPVRWIEEVCGEYLWSRQKDIAMSFVNNRYTAVKAGHGIGKSWLYARLIAWWVSTRPLGEAVAIFTAPTFNQVWSIIGKELAAVHRKANLPGKLINRNTEWWIDGILVAQGLKPDDNNDNAFQGRHERYVLGLGDEADGLPASIWTGLDAIATGPNCRIGVIGNPQDPSGQFATVCGDNIDASEEQTWESVLTIASTDSPAFTGEECPAEILEKLVTVQWVEERRKRWVEGSNLWEGRVMGRFPKSAASALILPEWITAAINRELVGVDIGRYALDVARFGDAETCIYRNRGGVIRYVDSAYSSSAPEVKRMAKAAIESSNFQAPMNIDGDGLGGPIYDDLHEDDYPVYEFRGGTTRTLVEPEDFADLRSETYWALREMFRKGEIDIDGADKLLVKQLASLRFKLTRTGKIQVETKDDMRKRKVKSPDRADTVMMSACYLGDADGAFGRSMRDYHEDLKASPNGVGGITAGLLDEPM